MASVTIRWENGQGTVTPSSISAGRGDSVEWSAEGSGATITFPDEAIFGKTEVYVPDGETKELTVEEDAPLGTHSCPVRCDADRNTPPTTTPVELEIP